MPLTSARLSYDGPALQAHTMDVRLLTPALLAFGDLAEEAARTLWGDQVSVKVEVKASFKTGSFGIDLSVAADLAQQVMQWLRGETASSLVNGAALLGAVGSLVGALQWLRGRQPRSVEAAADGKRRLLCDGDALEVEEHTIALLRSVRVREHLWQVVAPIEGEGVDTVALGTDERLDVVIYREQAAWFVPPPAGETVVHEDERTMAFSIVSLSFKEGNKWRLSDGNVTAFVEVADQDFLSRVDRNLVRFAKGDILIGHTRISQRLMPDGNLRTDYTLLRVLDHRAGTPQLELPMH